MAQVTPTLSSVFRHSDAWASWSKLKDDHELSQLCSQFWGKTIEDEAKQWRKSHSTVEVDRANDIGPECCGLDLGIELKCSKLWVRQDYIRIYNYCSKRHEEGSSSVIRLARSVAITGQAGVGKTYWISYAVRRRLGEQKPFLWYPSQGGFCFLFVKDGVFQQDVKCVSARDFAPFLWAFIDGDACPTGVPERLAGLTTNLYIIFTTSLKREQWKTLTKYTMCAVVIMNTWTSEEIRLAAKIHGLTDEQQKLAEAYFKELGPIPRMCFDFAEDPSLLVDYENRCQGIVANLTSHSFRHIVITGGALDLDANYHAIFLVRRQDVDDLERAYIEPISVNVAMRLMIAINELQQLERINLYHTFASFTPTRSVAGLVYESLGHLCIQKGVSLTLKPMGRSYMQEYFHWRLGSQSEVSNSMVQDDTVVFFPPKPGNTYEDGLTSVEPNRLHIPKATNHVALDSFFKFSSGGDTFLYIFQFTIADNHDIKKGITESLAPLMDMLPPKTNWRFVFITPPGCEVDVRAKSEVKNFLEGVTLYSAHSEIE